MPVATTTSKAEPPSPEVTKALQELSAKQLQALTDATVIAHRAYQYRGYSSLNPIPTAKLIAVDVEFRNYKPSLDLDDIDIVDAKSNNNHGSDPQVVRLTSNGDLAPNPEESAWPENFAPLRVLLIYAVPQECSAINLAYWGKVLLATPQPISGTGPSLTDPTSRKSR